VSLAYSFLKHSIVVEAAFACSKISLKVCKRPINHVSENKIHIYHIQHI